MSHKITIFAPRKKCQKNVKSIISNIAAAFVSLPYMYKVRCEK
nr:MAG TPA: hypothetical protein [Caudoviricetes sp.]